MPPNITIDFEGDNKKIRENITLLGMDAPTISSAELLSDVFPAIVFERASSVENKASFHFEDSRCKAKRRTSSFSEKEDDESFSSTSSASSYARMPTSPLQAFCAIVDPMVDSSIDSDSSRLLTRTAGCINHENEPLLFPSKKSSSNESTSVPCPCEIKTDHLSFLSLRLTYLLVTLVIMLADGLQGTQLIIVCLMFLPNLLCCC